MNQPQQRGGGKGRGQQHSRNLRRFIHWIRTGVNPSSRDPERWSVRVCREARQRINAMTDEEREQLRLRAEDALRKALNKAGLTL